MTGRWGVRARLTALYGGLFALAGAVLLAVTYLLVRQSLDGGGTTAVPDLLALRKLGGAPLDEVVESFRAAEERYRDGVLDSLVAWGALALLCVGLVAVGVGWLVARRALDPVHRITETARRITAGQGLHERIPAQGARDEVAELAGTFNAMLDRLDRAFDGQRRFVADASHEMRTPLAVKRALIEVAITRPGASADARRLGAELLEVNARHERLIDGLLALADAETEPAERTPTDLAGIAEHVLRQSGAADVGVEVLRDLGPASVDGDPVLLERLVRNLVDNAVKHNHAGGRLEVVSRDGVLVVANTGPEIQPYEVEGLFRPFRRLDRARTTTGERGLGLGLSIVRAIAAAHGGTVTAAPRADGGLEVTVRFGGGG
ncbi:ATP-binding protein [Actinosynnema sp. NPDC047251]|uniref:histidine kinase n=1 Tax=Saccharothrix espanaensis (strain ATCC 51144 / DSM 44229 / JCM 9112 / NBRC 15066 / NRRL 15764) TaxID=1179773 RepID=K0JPR9_SACES|nr:ATP-binding protein [Saccharothrix espanaensis]CCH29085.1 Sensor protein, CutS family [Saccharothrix espanaensis DSM 44229]